MKIVYLLPVVFLVGCFAFGARQPAPAYRSRASTGPSAGYRASTYVNRRFYHTADELNRQVARWTAGYRRVGAPIRMNLQAGWLRSSWSKMPL